MPDTPNERLKRLVNTTIPVGGRRVIVPRCNLLAEIIAAEDAAEERGKVMGHAIGEAKGVKKERERILHIVNSVVSVQLPRTRRALIAAIREGEDG